MYTPSQEIVDKYADVLVNFAINGGRGIKAGEVVYCAVPEWARPIYGSLQETILRAGANPIMSYRAMGFDRSFFELASDKQVAFFPEPWYRGLVDTIDHRIFIYPMETPHGLEGILPSKIVAHAQSFQPLRAWLTDKEAAGKYSWTLGFWGTEEYAAEAEMTLEEYWGQIIAACYLDEPDPIKKWRDTYAEINRIRRVLSAMPIDRLHITAEGTDLWVALGKARLWCGGGGRNIPSFEIFTSPDYRETEGHISFDQPLFYSGYKIEKINLRFKAGCVVEAHAAKNEEVLREMIAQTNLNHLGEFSLTDSRMSRITKPMCNTLFDENIGGKYGNIHIALGASYKDTYAGDQSKLTPEGWESLGFNDPNCAIHTDIISTSDRCVEAWLYKGMRVIYRNGVFTV